MFKLQFRGLFANFDVDQFSEQQFAMWYFVSFMITIVMMTMLIAIVSQAYDKAMENIDRSSYKSLAELILDTELLMIWNRLSSNEVKNFIVFAEKVEVSRQTFCRPSPCTLTNFNKYMKY